MLQDVKRGRYHKLQSGDPGLLVVATKLGIQIENGARAAGVSVLPAETVRSLMLDKRKVQSQLLLHIQNQWLHAYKGYKSNCLLRSSKSLRRITLCLMSWQPAVLHVLSVLARLVLLHGL